MRQSLLQQKGLSALDKVMLDTCGAFSLPPPSVAKALIQNYMLYCDPWSPIVERHWLEGSDSRRPSLLLVKALLLAGSQVSESPSASALSRELYMSSKILVVCAYEQNPIVNIIACCLLGWWNQYEQGEFSLDTSSHWLRTAIGIAYYVGLHKEPAATWEGKFRRRLWWSLVVSCSVRVCLSQTPANSFQARDCQVSAARGQPTTVNLDASFVLPPSVNDFPKDARHPAHFVAYVEISLILASLCGSCQKGQISNDQKFQKRSSLHRWLRELPPDLRYLSGQTKPEPSLQNFPSRQLHAIYLAVVSILYCSTSNSQELSATAIVSSSFMVTLLEEFLIRDEFRFLPATFAFYIVSAAVPQIAAYWSLDCHADIKRNLEIIKSSLSSLSLKWPTAKAAVTALEDREKLSSQRTEDSQTKIISSDEGASVLFEGFDPGSCCHWKQLFKKASSPPNFQANGDLSMLGNLQLTSQSSQGFGSGVQDFLGPMSEEDGIDLPFFSLPSCGPSDGYPDDFGAWVFERYLDI